MKTIEVSIETDDGYELDIEFEYTYHFQPAYLSGAPEDCHLEEEFFEFELSEDHNRYNALEWWAIQSVDDDCAYDLCVVN